VANSRVYNKSARQESRAIAKLTARCALDMGALKNFGSPWLRPSHGHLCDGSTFSCCLFGKIKFLLLFLMSARITLIVM